MNIGVKTISDDAVKDIYYRAIELAVEDFKKLKETEIIIFKDKKPIVNPAWKGVQKSGPVAYRTHGEVASLISFLMDGYCEKWLDDLEAPLTIAAIHKGLGILPQDPKEEEEDPAEPSQFSQVIELQVAQ